VTVNSVRSVYDPIHMIETRVTASYNTILHSADAVISADPNSFLESKFEGNEGLLYTPITTASARTSTPTTWRRS